MEHVSVCFYPTTTLFVDDSYGFLKSISVSLRKEFSYQCFSKPYQAIDYIKENEAFGFWDQSMGVKAKRSPYNVELDFTPLIEKINLSRRFSEPSVVFIDYNLGKLNGVDYCADIANPHIKKVLLTGVADEKVAVQAMNNKVIDYYLKKDSPKLFDTINDLIPKLQKQYFHSLFQPIQNSLNSAVRVFDDLIFSQYFYDICKQLNIMEYHFTPKPIGFSLSSHTGEKFKLLIYDDETLNYYCELMHNEDGADKLIQALSTRQQAPYFFSADGRHNENFASGEYQLYPITQIDGNRNYYCILVDANNLSFKHEYQAEHNPSIRSATLYDTQEASQLIYNACTSGFDGLFKKQAIEFIKFSFQKESGVLGYKNCKIITMQDNTVGTVIYYSNKEFDRLIWQTIKQIIVFFGLLKSIWLLKKGFRSELNNMYYRPKKNEIYIAQLCLGKEIKDKKIILHLMEALIRKIKESGKSICSIDLRLISSHNLDIFKQLGFKASHGKDRMELNLIEYKGRS